MDKSQIALKLAVEGLGLPLSVDSFQNRLILQKGIYLAQVAGVQLGYHYQWYLHGPYSPSLTRDEYAAVDELSQDLDDSKGWTLDDSSRETLSNLRKLINLEDQNELAKKLELLASVHFLITREQVARDDDEQIAGTLKRFRKPFNKRDVKRARGELQRYGLL
jgi:uncharacterized protein YwgA